MPCEETGPATGKPKLYGNITRVIRDFVKLSEEKYAVMKLTSKEKMKSTLHQAYEENDQI